jgi:diamine N-acetyltransferase
LIDHGLALGAGDDEELVMIYGKLVRLRALTRDDLPRLVEWRNDPEIKALLGGWSFPTFLEAEQEWLEQARCDQSTQRLAIEVLEDGRYIGNIGLYDIDWKNRKAEYGILIGDKDAWGKGYGFDASKALLEFAFCELNLHRVFLRVLAHHGRAIRLYEKIGFQVEGRMRQDTFRGGVYRDTLIMGLLASEFGG